ARRLSFRVDRSVVNHDRLRIKGRINPRGSKTDLDGATMQLNINGTDISGPVSLNSRGTAQKVVGTATIKARFSNATGRYSYRIRGLNVSEAIGLPKASGSGLWPLNVTINVKVAVLVITSFSGKYET